MICDSPKYNIKLQQFTILYFIKMSNEMNEKLLKSVARKF